MFTQLHTIFFILTETKPTLTASSRIKFSVKHANKQIETTNLNQKKKKQLKNKNLFENNYFVE